MTTCWIIHVWDKGGLIRDDLCSLSEDEAQKACLEIEDSWGPGVTADYDGPIEFNESLYEVWEGASVWR